MCKIILLSNMKLFTKPTNVSDLCFPSVVHILIILILLQVPIEARSKTKDWKMAFIIFEEKSFVIGIQTDCSPLPL